MFNALHLVDLVIGLVFCLPKFMVYYDFLLALFLVISVLAKRLAGKSVSDMTYIVSSGMLNLNSINVLEDYPSGYMGQVCTGHE